MRATLIYLVLIPLFGITFSEINAQDAVPQLQFGYNLRTESRGDSVHVTFSVHATNVHDDPFEVCGAFYFSCIFEESTGSEHSSERCPRFLVLDRKIGALLQCESMVIGVGEPVQDTLKFAFSPGYFGDCSGSIKIKAEFIYGSAGDKLNDAKRAGGDLLRIFIPIN
jgi:hypothetical protein